MAGHNDVNVHSCRSTQTLTTLRSDMDPRGLFMLSLIYVYHSPFEAGQPSSRYTENQRNYFLLPQLCHTELTRASSEFTLQPLA